MKHFLRVASYGSTLDNIISKVSDLMDRSNDYIVKVNRFSCTYKANNAGLDRVNVC